MEKNDDKYTCDVLRIRYSMYRDNYIKTSEIIKTTNLPIRQQNPPEDVTENIVKFIKELPENLLVNETFAKFHGDFILDNIIKTSDSFKLIDWRHEFDKELYYGDVYYELAKLRHNIIFNHSNILNNLFEIEYKNDEVIVDLKCNYFLIQQLNDFEQFVNENNYDINKIKIITSIIWLNMSPLYDGKLSEFLFYFGKYNLFMLF